MYRQTSDPSFVDVLIRAGRNDRLDRIDRLIDWPKVAHILDDIHAASEGRPAYPPITMVKIIVLQQWYDASDAGMEEALQNRLSFRRFAGIRSRTRFPTTRRSAGSGRRRRSGGSHGRCSRRSTASWRRKG